MNTTDDVFRAVIRFLDANSRFNLAEVDSQLHKLSLKWIDVDSVLIDSHYILLGSDYFRHIVTFKQNDFKTVIKSIFSLCSAVKYLYIQNEITEDDIMEINPYLTSVQHLYLTAAFFNKNRVGRFKTLKVSSLQSMFILQPTYELLSSCFELNAITAFKSFPNTLKTICLTGLTLYPSVLKYLFTLPDIKTLNLIGCLVDTSRSFELLRELNQHDTLKVLSLPPSLFSLSDRASYTTNPIPFFKKMRIIQLSLYMEKYDDNFFWSFIEALPNCLELLIIYGNHSSIFFLPRVKLWNKFEMRFEQLNSSIVHPPWSNYNIKLIHHLVNCSPSVFSEQPWRYTIADSNLDPATHGTLLSANQEILFPAPENTILEVVAIDERRTEVATLANEDNEMSNPPSTPSPSVSPVRGNMNTTELSRESSNSSNEGSNRQ